MAEFGEVTIEGEGEVSVDEPQYPEEGEGYNYDQEAATAADGGAGEQGEYAGENEEFDGSSVEYQLNDTLDVC